MAAKARTSLAQVPLEINSTVEACEPGQPSYGCAASAHGRSRGRGVGRTPAGLDSVPHGLPRGSCAALTCGLKPLGRLGPHTPQLCVGTWTSLELTTPAFPPTGHGGRPGSSSAVELAPASVRHDAGGGTCCAPTQWRQNARDLGHRGPGTGVAGPAAVARGSDDFVLWLALWAPHPAFASASAPSASETGWPWLQVLPQTPESEDVDAACPRAGAGYVR